MSLFKSPMPRGLTHFFFFPSPFFLADPLVLAFLASPADFFNFGSDAVVSESSSSSAAASSAAPATPVSLIPAPAPVWPGAVSGALAPAAAGASGAVNPLGGSAGV